MIPYDYSDDPGNKAWLDELAYDVARKRAAVHFERVYAAQAAERAEASRREMAARRAGTYVPETTRPTAASTRATSPRSLDKVLTRIGLSGENRKKAAAMLARDDMDGLRLADGTVIRKLNDGTISVERGKTAYSRVQTANVQDANWQLRK